MSRASALLLSLFLAVPGANSEVPSKIEDVVKGIDARFEPADARPGQSVTLTIELKLANGWQTYPTKQKDAAVRYSVNKITFPKGGAVLFSGKVTEPPNPTIVKEPDLDIMELHTYPGGGTWKCEARIAPTAKPGLTNVSIRFLVLVVKPNGDGHFAPKSFDVDATIKIGEPLPEKNP